MATVLEPLAHRRENDFVIYDTVMNNTVLHHCIFWLIYFIFNTFRWGSYFDDYAYSLRSNLVSFPVHMLLSYAHLYLIFPAFIPKKRYWQYVAVLLGTVLLVSLLKIVAHYELVSSIVWRESYKEEEMFGINHILAVTLGEFYVIGLTTAIKLTIDRVRTQKKTQELQRQTLETELNFLKSQIQPHFFFNTLNNLYSLTLERSEKAPEVVLKLSELMSYVLYEANSRQVSLFKEIKHIRNYIELEQLRFGKRLKVNMELSGELSGKTVAPLILIPFVENVFKHGVKNKMQDIEVTIILQADEKYLTLEVENDKSDFEDEKKLPGSAETGGIGLKNTRRRLELLYRENFVLDIENLPKTYKVRLKIPFTNDDPMPDH